MEKERVADTLPSLVKLNPEIELNFNVDEKKTETQCLLQITNTATSPILFKLKTTAPKEYCVRPNSGRIDPGATTSVSVILQDASKKKLPDVSDKKKSDKFLIQTAPLPQSSSGSEDLWTLVPKDQIREAKLKCLINFDSASGASSAPSSSVSTSTSSIPAAAQSTTTSKEVRSEPTPATLTSEKPAEIPAPVAQKPVVQQAAAAPTKVQKKVDSEAPRPVTSDSSSSKASSVTTSSLASPSTKTATAGAAGNQGIDNQSIIFLLIAFLLGVVFGRFVL